MFWLQYLRPGQTWSDTDLAKRRILCQIPSHVITTSRSPPLPSLENHLNFPEPNAPHRRSFYLFLFQTRVTEPLGLGGSRGTNVEISGATQQLLCSKSPDFLAIFALEQLKINQIE